MDDSYNKLKNFDSVIWMGDLNFRLQVKIGRIMSLMENDSWSILKSYC